MPGQDPAREAAAALHSLLDRFPRVRLGLVPTPLEHMPRLGAGVGHGSLWVKRDDLIGLGLGGNKVRNLEYLLGEALDRGANTVITSGGLQSNLCRLTAAACARLGLDCVLVHNDDRPVLFQGNLLLNHLAGAEPVYLGPVTETERAAEVEVLARRMSGRGRRPYVIRNGASTPLGALGFVRAAVELWEQSGEAGTEFGHVAIVGAMGGTAAGFVLGTALLGCPFHVHVVSVEYGTGLLRSLIRSIAAGAAALLRSRGTIPGGWPGLEEIDRAMTTHGGYVGPGYGAATPGALTALFDAARAEGLLLETVYTGKTLAGCLDLIRRREIPAGKACCYWHTGGTAALFAQAALLWPRGEPTPQTAASPPDH